MAWGWAFWGVIGAAFDDLALTFVAQGYITRPLALAARTACFAAGASLMFPDLIDDWAGGMVVSRLIGVTILGAVIAYEVVQSRMTAATRPPGW